MLRARSTSDGRSRGRAAAAVLAAALGVVAFAAAVVFFLKREDPRPAVEEPAPAEAAPDGREAGAGEGRAAPAGERAAARGTPIADGDARSGDAVGGRVVGPDGQPMASATVRAVPIDLARLRDVDHDGRLVEPAIPLDHFGAGPVRDALAKARTTETDEEGAFEIRPSASPGTLVVYSEGRALVLSSYPAPDGGRVEIALGPGGTVSGAVRDESTLAPATGMTVHAAAAAGPGARLHVPSVAESARARVGLDGRYRLVGVPPGDRRVLPSTGESDFVSVPWRRARAVVSRAETPVDGIDFAVSLGGRVSGAVRDSVRAGVAGAAVRVLPENALSETMRGAFDVLTGLGETETTTDARGRFEVKGRPFGTAHALYASADGFAPAKVSVPPLTRDEPVAEIDVALGPGSTIAGTVVRPGGSPAPGIDVTVSPSLANVMSGHPSVFGAKGSRSSATSDDSGRFSFSRLPPGTYVLRAGPVNVYDPFDAAGLGETVEVDGVETRDGVELELAEEKAQEPGDVSGAIAGIVRDDRGLAVEGADVKVAPSEGGGGLFSFLDSSKRKTATTAADGTFRVTGLEPATAYGVEAKRSGHSVATLERVNADGTPIEIVLTRTASVRGIVLFPDGSPAPAPFAVRAIPAESDSPGNVFAEFMPNADARRKERSAAGNADGTFLLEDVPPGLLEIVADVPGHAPGSSGAIAVAAGEAVEGLALRVTAGAAVRGVVALPSGAPVARAEVAIEPAAKSDAADALRRYLPEYARKGMRIVVTDERGAFEIGQLASGRYTLSATHEAYAPSRETPVYLRPDEIASVPPIVLSLGATIAGVAKEKDAPRPGLMVQAIGEGPMRMTTTDERGEFLIEKLPPGAYMLTVMDMSSMAAGKGMSMKTRHVTVEADRVARIEFVFGVGARVFGSVLGGKSGGGGAAIRVVTLRRPGGPAPEDVDPLAVAGQLESARYQAGVAIVGPDGAYVIEDVEPGTYILEMPVMPENPLDFDGYATLDRTPPFRREIVVGEKDVEIDVVLP